MDGAQNTWKYTNPANPVRNFCKQKYCTLPVVGHMSFYAKMDLTKFGVLYKNRTPGSDPVKGGHFYD